ncbi:hypothetical protein ACIGJK_03785 [Pseudomonas iridis]|uniref:hypothetical protein n=1 Tax=Pseudomonas iridis TaxID=2710587 RepID=UPI0037CBD7E9
MTILTEDGLQINFNGAQRAMKFDQKDPSLPDFHDLQNMPRVDFIVETDKSIYFIEIKDPGRPDAVDVGGTKLLKKIVSGTLEASLIEKYIFSFFYRWAECELDKSVHYVSLITLESALLQPIVDGMERLMINFSKKSHRWSREPLASCQIHNIETWQAVFPHWPVTRLAPVMQEA